MVFVVRRVLEMCWNLLPSRVPKTSNCQYVWEEQEKKKEDEAKSYLEATPEFRTEGKQGICSDNSHIPAAEKHGLTSFMQFLIQSLMKVGPSTRSLPA